eukprot:s1271_g10.t1
MGDSEEGNGGDAGGELKVMHNKYDDDSMRVPYVTEGRQGDAQKSLPPRRVAAAKSTSGKGGGRGRSGPKAEPRDEEGESGEDGNTQRKSKKQKTDPKVSARLQKLDVEKTVLLTSSKWSEKVRVGKLGGKLQDMVKGLFLAFASTAPEVELSPEARKNTCLGTAEKLPEPSPNSKAKRSAALDDPSKKGLKDYDKVMQSHEAAVRKGIQELDKAIQDFREASEKNSEVLKKTKERLERKKKLAEEKAAECRRTVSVYKLHMSYVTLNPLSIPSGLHSGCSALSLSDLTLQKPCSDLSYQTMKGKEEAADAESSSSDGGEGDTGKDAASRKDEGKNKKQKTVSSSPSRSESGSSSSDVGEKGASGAHEPEKEDYGNEYPPTWPVAGLDFENDTLWSRVRDWTELDDSKDQGLQRLSPSAVKKLYSKEEWESCNWRKVLATRNAYSGPDWTNVCTTEMGWGRCYYVNDGEQLIFGMSLQTLLMSFCKEHGKGVPTDVDGADIETLGEYFAELPVKDLVNLGGFYIHLKKGQGIVIPPLYMVGFVNSFQLRHPPTGEMAEETVANAKSGTNPTMAERSSCINVFVQWLRDCKVTSESLLTALSLPIFGKVDDGLKAAWEELAQEAINIINGTHAETTENAAVDSTARKDLDFHEKSSNPPNDAPDKSSSRTNAKQPEDKSGSSSSGSGQKTQEAKDSCAKEPENDKEQEHSKANTANTQEVQEQQHSQEKKQQEHNAQQEPNATNTAGPEESNSKDNKEHHEQQPVEAKPEEQNEQMEDIESTPPPPPPSPDSPLRLPEGHPVRAPEVPVNPTTPLFSKTNTGIPPSPPSPDDIPLSLPPPPEAPEPETKDPEPEKPDTRTLYQILGVDPRGSDADLRKAYLSRSKQVHPDKQASGQGSTSTIEFQKLSNAYNILSNPSKRMEYDFTLNKDLTAPAETSRPPRPKATPKGKGKAKAKARFSPKKSAKAKASPKPKPKVSPKKRAKAKACASSPAAPCTPDRKTRKRKAKTPPVHFYPTSEGDTEEFFRSVREGSSGSKDSKGKKTK